MKFFKVYSKDDIDKLPQHISILLKKNPHYLYETETTKRRKLVKYSDGGFNYIPIKCDLWSIGVIIYKLKFNEVPLTLYGGDIPGKFANKHLDDLVRKLIVYDPNKRIGWNEYFNHPFFKN